MRGQFMRTKTIKTYLLSILLMAAGMLCMPMSSYAALPGTTCATAIPLGDNYKDTISGPSSVWYTATTFDLPLTVYFAPENETDPAPLVEMDFSCTSGVYEDSIICSLFCTNSGSGIQFDMPHRPSLTSDTLGDGTFVYYLSMGKSYRDLLLKMGIDYNVTVYVKVTYYSAGVISIAPDDLFSNCMDGHKFMHYGDTVQVVANDKDRHVVVPYVQWQEDSIRYIWEGTEDVMAVVGYECGYDPTDYTTEVILDRPTLKAPKDTFKMTSEELKYYVSQAESQAGMFYAKFYTTGTGIMKIEQVPMDPPSGGATLLKFDKPVVIAANDTNALYAIPYSWDTTVIFTTPTDHIFRMYVGTSSDFYTKDAIATYQFSKNESGHWLGLLADEMEALLDQRVGNYLYVRFECTAKTTLTPAIWDASYCMTNAIEIKRPSTTLKVQKGTYGAVYYRFYYSEWSGGDMTFSWTDSNGDCPTIIGDTCTFGTSQYDSHRIGYKKIAKNKSWTIPAANVADWAEYVDADGYLYVRFNPSYAGQMTVSTTAPDEEDPVCEPTTGDTTANGCNSFVWYGTTYTESGDYTRVLTNACGLDSTVTLHLTITPSYQITLPDTTVCDEYVWGDTTITTGGTYTRYLKTASGCDSILTQTVTVNQSSRQTDIVTAYETYTWVDGVTYTSSTKGNSYEKVNESGCPLYLTLDLTIRHIHYDTLRQSVCPNELPYVWRNQPYTEAGTYTADTVKSTASVTDTLYTLVLAVKAATASEESQSACSTYTWNGTTYTESGDYTYQTQNAAGCDSTATLLLTINQPTTSEETVKVSNSYTWHGQTYTSSGNYTWTTTNAAGCDSIVTLHLTIVPPVSGDTVISYFCTKSGITEHIDDSGDPIISYIAYQYEKPEADIYMANVISGETSTGAYVDFVQMEANLDAYYVTPLTPVEQINLSYRNRSGEYQTLGIGSAQQWINTGTVLLDFIFRCGYRYYGSFTVGNMTEDIDQTYSTDEPAIKRIENGQVVIIRGGAKYNLLGSKIE